MNGPPPGRRHALLALLLPLGILVSGACNIFTDDEPQHARVEIEGAAGHPLEVVTSSDFDVVADQGGENRETVVFAADTAEVTSPFARVYGLGSRKRFHLVVSSDSIVSAADAVTVRVYIDGDRRYARTTYFDDEDIEFTYAFR